MKSSDEYTSVKFTADVSEKDIMELTECVNTWNNKTAIASLNHINSNNGDGRKKLDDKLIGEKEELEKRDIELENIVGNLMIAEYQENQEG